MKSFVSFLLAAGALVKAAPPDACPDGIATITEYPQVGVQPVVINQEFSNNTVIIINGGVTIDITNAPTFISTVINATVTSTVTVTSGVTPPGATGVVFAVQFFPVDPAAARLAKRQSFDPCLNGGLGIGLLGANGFVVDSLSDASLFFQNNGSMVNSASGDVVSTSDDIPNIPFAASPVVGEISTVFDLDGEGIISWSSDAFDGTLARFFFDDDPGFITVNFDGVDVDDSILVFPVAINPFNPFPAPNCATSSTSGTVTPTTSSNSTITSSSLTSTITGNSTTTDSTSSPSLSPSASANATSTTSSATTGPSADASCDDPDATCATAQLSTAASSLIDTLNGLVAAITTLNGAFGSADTSITGLLAAGNIVTQFPALLTSLTTAGTTLGAASPLDAGCNSDALAIAASSLADLITTLATTITSRSGILGSIPVLSDILATGVGQLSGLVSTIGSSVAGLTPSRACFVTNAFTGAVDALSGGA